MKNYDQRLKERVISDYLSGGGSYRQLQGKYDIDFRLINQWVQDFKGTGTKTVKPSQPITVKLEEDIPKDVKQLQDELRQARLYNKLLEAFVDIGKEQYGIDLRKKHGRKLYGMMESFLHQQAIGIGRDAFFDVLREYGLLVRIRRRKAQTTEIDHQYRKYANLIKEFISIAANKLWVCDITYIVIGDSFGYLSLITDAYSRKIVGFCLHKTLSAQGPILALKQASKKIRIQKD